MITNAHIPEHLTQRVLLCNVPGRGGGTCFVVDHDGKRYLATSDPETDDVSEFSILHGGDWQELDVELVGRDQNVAVWSPTGLALLDLPKIDYGVNDRVGLGRSVYAIGFALLQGIPFQVVTNGVVAISQDDQPEFMVDTLPTHMMQGGLVAAQSEGSDDWTICGMVFGLIYSDGPDGPDQSMAGFMRVLRIEKVLELVEDNPIGQPIDMYDEMWGEDSD